jgi:hypothetical protein
VTARLLTACLEAASARTDYAERIRGEEPRHLVTCLPVS